MHSLLIILVFFTHGYAFIMPMTKTDGSPDLISLISHITLLEQTNQQSTAEVAELKSQMRTALDELKDVKTDLKDNQAKVAVLECKLLSIQLPGANADIKLDVASLKSEMASLKSQCSCEGTGNTSVKSAEIPSTPSGIKDNASYVGGATFTRWGRTSCPPGNKIVYKGFTGGSSYSYLSSTATILCLPDHPIYDEQTDGAQSAFIWGTEYETGSYTGSHWKGLQDDDMPCVICKSEYMERALMVPARNQCFTGWNLEYHGYLMGAAEGYASAEFICVDNDPESIVGGQANLEGQVLYLVESKCGSLPCPPYKDNWELTCAVCSHP